MKGKTHNTEEMIRILRQGDGGETAQSVCRKHNISDQTFYRWKIECSKRSIQKNSNPLAKKSAVAHAVQQRLCSVRRACTYLASLDVSLYPEAVDRSPRAALHANHCFILVSSALWLPPHPHLVGKRGLDGKP